MEKLYIGTCSWKYPSWEYLVYPPGSEENFLKEYAKKYNSVEVDQWFWSLGKRSIGLPKAETVQEYDQSTGEEFRFTIKCPNALTLTHHYSKNSQLIRNEAFLDIELFNSFWDALYPIHAKIGLLMFQFEYLNRTKMTSRALFMDQLHKFFEAVPADLPYAIEIRNPRWFDSIWFSFLRQRNICPVLIEGYWMDSVAALLDRYEEDLGQTVCIRLHGDDRSGIEVLTGGNWDRRVQPKDDDLAQIARSVTRILQGDRVVYVNINNHYEGSAPLTIESFTSYLRAMR
ncbi:MAG: DUF72 domain-containing protein [Sphaerochaetaceae bacterium]|nr:DUF72 domain-containing protein [Sphaerochaetaceae bacterium]